ncbi:PTS glucose transporter subunit IIA [Weissella ceti]|uniref:PTS glucose transporter subunit IIA n=1 Tax=Weissella ceti TaxID=759620 RepID=A0ABT3E5H3_9LACO|nr:PTS glucose transporter subunit IIA [Weissella ceti]MCW0953462.1 PTS glucose transporter subunit IIA [Weissella ceti]QVK12063.1 PTS glucose transporter subunit IIA [Weissella ceti]
MFGLGKKKVVVADVNLYAPVNGTVIDLTTVPDPVFAGKMMGDGFAIEPDDSRVVAPVAGEVTMLQGHAVGFKRADGLEILIHMGIDTVSLDGAPFDMQVQVGDVLEAGEPIAIADWAQIEAAGLPRTTMVLITNTTDKLANLDVQSGPATAGELIGKATAK